MKFITAIFFASVAAVKISDNKGGDELPDLLKPKAPLTALQVYGLKEKCNELFRKEGKKITLEYPDLVKEATGATVVKFAQ